MRPLLYDAIEEYRPAVRFHMPAHCGNLSSPLYASAPFDVTELSFSDNLSLPQGLILQAEKAVASAAGSPYSLFFTAGATSAMFVAVCITCERVEKYTIVGEVHKCVTNALKLFRRPYEKCDAPEGAEAIILTTPDYFGMVKDVAELRRKNPNAIIIADEAHGAHFAYSSLLPDSAIKYADIVVQSMHKTMPVYSGGALLHVKKESDYLAAIEARAELHTSSPSYLTMASMDYARWLFEENGERYYENIQEAVENLSLPEGFIRRRTDDFSRLVINTPEETTGYAVAADAEKQGIFFETSTSDSLVAIVTPFNFEKLALLKNLRAPKTEKEDLSHLLGQRARNDLILYPPGSILLRRGEVIDEKTLEIIIKEKGRILGL